MAWSLKVRRTRPSTSVAFERISEEVQSYRETNYDDTGKLLAFTITESADGLQETATLGFRDEAAKNEFLADSTLSTEFTRRNNVNTGNSITKEIIEDQEV